MHTVVDAIRGAVGLLRLAEAWHARVVADETSVIAIHSGNGLHDEMDRRAIECFDEALGDVGLTADDPPGKVLHE